MPSYAVNDRAVARARQLIDARQYILDSDWGDDQPGAGDENKFLESHSWEEYAEWHLGLTEGATDETKTHSLRSGPDDFSAAHNLPGHVI